MAVQGGTPPGVEVVAVVVVVLLLLLDQRRLCAPQKQTWQPTFTTKPDISTSGRFGSLRSSPSSRGDIKSRKFQTRQAGASARGVGVKCAPGGRARGRDG